MVEVQLFRSNKHFFRFCKIAQKPKFSILESDSEFKKNHIRKPMPTVSLLLATLLLSFPIDVLVMRLETEQKNNFSLSPGAMLYSTMLPLICG